MRQLWLGWVIAVGVACAPQAAAPTASDPTPVAPDAPGAIAEVAPATPGTIAEAAPAPPTPTGGAPTPSTPHPAPKPTTTPAPPPVRAPPPRPSSPVASSLPDGIRACTTAADCTIHCASAPGCCPDAPCGCRNAIRKDARDTYDAWFASSCTQGPNCPAMGCARDDAMGVTCRDGRCVATDGPGF